MNKLAEIQSKIKAPKGQFNKFGGYKYRSAEDIVEAVKPVINPLGIALVITDEVILLGSRFYVKATATLTDGKESYSSTAYAREDESIKGMAGAQITGAASSYARKYALNGLFAIDDTKDADATNTHDHDREEILPTQEEKNILKKLVWNSNLDDAQQKQALLTIDECRDYDRYAKIEAKLLGIQKTIDEISAPSAAHIKSHLRKIAPKP